MQFYAMTRTSLKIHSTHVLHKECQSKVGVLKYANKITHRNNIMWLSNRSKPYSNLKTRLHTIDSNEECSIGKEQTHDQIHVYCIRIGVNATNAWHQPKQWKGGSEAQQSHSKTSICVDLHYERLYLSMLKWLYST